MADFNVLPHYGLATGAAISTTEDVKQLHAAGVGAIIDCREEFDDRPLLVGMRVPYLWDPTADDGGAKPTEWFQRAYHFAQPIHAHRYKRPGAHLIYAHCAAGVNRGPSMCYFLLRAFFRLNIQEARAAIILVRPQVGLRYAPDADRALVAMGLASA